MLVSRANIDTAFDGKFKTMIMNFDISKMKWIREPLDYSICDEKVEIITEPHTDLLQRTYYHFVNDNAPVLQLETDEKYFSFIVKTQFETKC